MAWSIKLPYVLITKNNGRSQCMRVKTFLKKPFHYLYTPGDKWVYIVGSVIFTLLFLIIFQPYGITEEMKNPENSSLHKILFFASIVFCIFVTLSFSQFYLRSLFQVENVSIRIYLLWFLFEIFLLTLVNFGMSFVIPDLGNDFERELNIRFQLINFVQGLLIMLFPFLASCLYSYIKQIKENMNELVLELSYFQKAFPEEHLVVDFTITDEFENVAISISLGDFLFAESANQYILVYYMDSGKLKKEIVRNRLKNIIKADTDSPIFQCHRSYVVNLLNVSHLIKQGQKNYLVFTMNEVPKVPVSKSYLEIIKEAIEK